MFCPLYANWFDAVAGVYIMFHTQPCTQLRQRVDAHLAKNGNGTQSNLRLRFWAGVGRFRRRRDTGTAELLDKAAMSSRLGLMYKQIFNN